MRAEVGKNVSQKADMRKSGHGQQSAVPLASLAAQLPAHRVGLSPPDLPREEVVARAPLYPAQPTVLEIRELTFRSTWPWGVRKM